MSSSAAKRLFYANKRLHQQAVIVTPGAWDPVTETNSVGTSVTVNVIRRANKADSRMEQDGAPSVVDAQITALAADVPAGVKTDDLITLSGESYAVISAELGIGGYLWRLKLKRL